MEVFYWELIGSVVRVSVPVIFAAMGGLLGERSGVVQIGLEGYMLIGSFFGALIALQSGSVWLGWWGAGIFGALFGLLYAYFSIKLKSDQVVGGTAVNLLALGLTPILCKVFYGSTGNTPSLGMEDRFHSAPLFMVFILVFIIWFWIKHTQSGLWWLFAGENPEALRSVGVSPVKVRFIGCSLAGFLAALGGASLSLFLSSNFTRNMTAGRGFMALAALILGKWKPIPTLFACLFFAFTEAIQMRLQGVVLWGSDPVPVQLIQILPYLITVIVIAGKVGKSRAPSGLGRL